jgi:hypothetical protein
MSILLILNKNPVLLFKQQAGRGIMRSDIQLIEPLNSGFEMSQLIFRWKEFEKADSYIFELFDDSLKLIWKSSKLKEAKYAPPSEMIHKMAPSHSYFWMITAVIKNGNVRESALAHFFIID